MDTEPGPDWRTLSNEFGVISAYSLLSVTSFEPYQQIAQTNAWLRSDEPPLALLFLSHRWDGAKHPDRSGDQLRAFQGLLKNTCLVMRALFTEREQRLTLVPDLNRESILQASELARRILGYGPFSGGKALCDERQARSYVRAQVKALEPEKFDDWLLEHIGVWVDFCCVPQQPRSRDEREVFERTLARIDTLLAASTVIALRRAGDDYAERAWCVSEIWLGAHRSFQRSLFLDIDRAQKELAPLLPAESNAAYYMDGKDKNGDLAAFQSAIARWQDEAVSLEHTPPDPWSAYRMLQGSALTSTTNDPNPGRRAVEIVRGLSVELIKRWWMSERPQAIEMTALIERLLGQLGLFSTDPHDRIYLALLLARSGWVAPLRPIFHDCMVAFRKARGPLVLVPEPVGDDLRAALRSVEPSSAEVWASRLSYKTGRSPDEAAAIDAATRSLEACPLVWCLTTDLVG